MYRYRFKPISNKKLVDDVLETKTQNSSWEQQGDDCTVTKNYKHSVEHQRVFPFHFELSAAMASFVGFVATAS
jgi:hypothetical protein